MESLQQSLQQSGSKIVFLQGQLSILTALAVQKQQSYEEEEIKRISHENEILRNDLLKLKQDLRYCRVQNGILQVDLPNSSSTATSAHPLKNECVETPDKLQEVNGSKKKGNKGTKGDGKVQKSQIDDTKSKDASCLNMKVGQIVNVKKHPDADGLYVDEVDVGEEKNRNIVSGLVKHYTLEEMQGQMGIFLCNIKPAKLRGVLSEGMILCAVSPEKIEILQVPEGSVVGERVICEGYPGEACNQLNRKKKIWEQIQPDLRVGTDGKAAYKGGVFTIIGKGVCYAPSMRDCIIK